MLDSNNEANTLQKNRRKLIGTIVKISGSKTLKVLVERKFPHPKYKKIVKKFKKYLVDYNGNIEDIEIGKKVVIEETKPISKLKSWKLIKILGS
ncbi:MAG: 30S ribosomal protein S17 [Candidatus Dojkabacteria bacterium]|nr:30S ribosomal protein S17 [Candidatus Dojkabacteria bacterium]